MRSIATTLIIFSSFVFNVFASTPTIVPAQIEQVYVPKGFDSNDNTEIILSGVLPNLCHKTPSTKFKIDGNNIFIKASTLKYESDNPFCPPVQVPFVHSVAVGVLKKGLYNIFVEGTQKIAQSIEVADAKKGATDDHIYAQVFFIETKENSRKILLKGLNPSNCLEFHRFQVVDNGKDVYSILPIMRQISEHCPRKEIPFEIPFTVPSELNAKKVLLHVRTMEGNSVNQVFNNN
jgi:hypothetical protein